MSPDQARKAANTFDPMRAIRWTPWQALAWIVHHDVDKVRECTRFAVTGAAIGPFRAIWEEVSDPLGLRRIDVNEEVEGWHELQRALESGKVKSSGRDVATGSKREISQLEWEDLRFAHPRVIEDGGYQYVHAEPQLYWEKDVAEPWSRPAPAFWDVRVLVADVLQAFPATGDKSSSSQTKPKGGRPPAADWAALEEALEREIDLVDLPHLDGELGWRTTADVARWLAERTGNAEPGKTALKDNAKAMLERIKAKKDGKQFSA
jgi:hypothetical protein